MSDLPAGYLCLYLILTLSTPLLGGLLISWLIGLLNPIGYMGIPPWKLRAEMIRRGDLEYEDRKGK